MCLIHNSKITKYSCFVFCFSGTSKVDIHPKHRDSVNSFLSYRTITKFVRKVHNFIKLQLYNIVFQISNIKKIVFFLFSIFRLREFAAKKLKVTNSILKEDATTLKLCTAN